LGAQAVFRRIRLPEPVLSRIFLQPGIESKSFSLFKETIRKIVHIDIGSPMVAAGSGHRAVSKDLKRPFDGIRSSFVEFFTVFHGGSSRPFIFPYRFLNLEIAR